MGTRSTIKFYNEDGDCVASIYRQFDGYPSGVGLELAEFLSKKTIINGFYDQKTDSFANGIGCLAAQYIAKIKTKIGTVYMTTENDAEEYNYIISINEQRVLKIKVNTLEEADDFEGTATEFLEFCKKDK